eukprot:gene13013-biopygen15545
MNGERGPVEWSNGWSSGRTAGGVAERREEWPNGGRSGPNGGERREGWPNGGRSGRTAVDPRGSSWMDECVAPRSPWIPVDPRGWMSAWHHVPRGSQCILVDSSPWRPGETQ